MRHLCLTLTACVFVLFGASSAHATWKWKDANGVVHISDRAPPSSVPEQSILSRPAGVQGRMVTQANRAAPPAPVAAASAPAAATPSAKADGKDPELVARQKKQAEAEEATRKEKEKTDAAARADNCKRAKSYQMALKEGMRIAVPGATGEREILDDKGRADETRRAQEVIDRDCK
jgi:Domain of unknown function (DUF4124)